MLNARFLHRKSSEIVMFHQLCSYRIFIMKRIQGVIDIDHFVRRTGRS